MGALTPIDKVWYPDESDIDQPNVYMATHAQSIEDGIGGRLRQQEVAVGLKANLPSASLKMTNTMQTIPYVITNGFGSFKQGMEITAGVVTVATKGMYLVTVSLGIENINIQRSVKVELYKNATKIATNEALSNTVYWTAAQATSVILCEPGDTIYAKGGVPSEANGIMNSAAGEYHFISIAMVQAVPA